MCESNLTDIEFSHYLSSIIRDGWVSLKLRYNQIDSSRRPSNESTCSLNVPLDRENTPQLATIASAILTKTRSQSLVNINKPKVEAWDEENLLNGIEESPNKNMRRRSLQNDGVRCVIENVLVLLLLCFNQQIKLLEQK